MKKTLFIIAFTLSILNADSFIDKFANTFPEPKTFTIIDGTEFIISKDEKAFVIQGKDSCNKDSSMPLFNPSNKMCTEFKNQDNYKFNVTLLLKTGKVLNENWMVKKIDKQVQVLRSNGFNIQLVK